MRKSYFTNEINSIEELKKEYFTLAKKYHSDINGGSDEEMKAINVEYEQLFARLKDRHTSIKEDSKEKYYTATKATAETAGMFINIINYLLKLDGVIVELCGSWVWVSGDTKKHKDSLKAAGCKYSAKKQMWSWHFNNKNGYHKRGNVSIQYIRNTYGSIVFKQADGVPLLA